MAVLVYTTPSCAACRATVQWLQRRGIEHEARCFESSPEAAQLAAAKGYKAAPVVVSGRSSWSGFRPDLIDKIMAIDAVTKDKL